MTEARIELPATGHFGPDWSSDGVIPYGSGVDQLGLDSSSEDCPPGCGPDSAALGPAGTWFVYDSLRHRVLEYNRSGKLLRDPIDLPAEVDGVTARGAHGLHVFDNASTMTLDNGDHLLRLNDGAADAPTLGGQPANPTEILGDNGTQLFMSWSGRTWAIDPYSENADSSDTPLRLRDGVAFTLRSGRQTLAVRWFDAAGAGAVSESLIDFGESFTYTWASELSGLVLLVSSDDGERGAIVHVTQSSVEAEPTVDPTPSRMDGLATLSTNKLGWTGVAAAADDGLHLYHRVAAGGLAAGPNLNGHTCGGSAPLSKDDTGQAPQKLTVDLDGDGRPDTLLNYRLETRLVVQAQLSNGQTTDPQTITDVFPEGEEVGGDPLGKHDFDGDGRDEVLLRSGGMTADAGGVAHLDRCRLVGIESATNLQGFSFLYGAHSNCCPDTRVYVTCSGNELIETTSQPDATAEAWVQMSEAERTRLRRTWERNAYRIGPTSARRISHTTGKTAPGEDVIPDGASGVHC